VLLQRKRVRSYHGARKTKILMMTAARAKVIRTRTKVKVVKAMVGVRKAKTALTPDREVMKGATAETEVMKETMAATEVTREATEETEVMKEAIEETAVTKVATAETEAMKEAEVIVMTVVVIAAVKR